MTTLVDTNLLTRTLQPNHPLYVQSKEAMRALRLNGDILAVVPQVIYEFWVVCTRPAAQNGLGLTITQCHLELDNVLSLFVLFQDNATLFPEWRRLVMSHQTAGKMAHDTRLVAAMHVHGITRLLTFNSSDFQRYRSITVLSPQAVIAGATLNP